MTGSINLVSGIFAKFILFNVQIVGYLNIQYIHTFIIHTFNKTCFLILGFYTGCVHSFNIFLICIPVVSDSFVLYISQG